MLTESQLLGRLAVKLSGSAAERLVTGEISTGVEADLEEATALARDMVARFGMASEVSPMRLFGSDASAFLGEETPLADIAPETKAAADEAVRRLMQTAEAEARKLLQQHRKVLDQFAATLAEHETLEGVILQRHLDELQKQISAGRRTPRAKSSATASNGDGSARSNGTAKTRRRTTVG